MENTKRIAVASEKSEVSNHFGHCSNFNVFDTVDTQIVNEVSFKNPGHKPGFIPKFLDEKGINVIIASKMGESARNLFNELNIEIVTGVSGNAKEAAQSYLNGTLKSVDVFCNEHDFEGHCND